MADPKVLADKIGKLTKYAEHVKTRLSGPVPDKHKHRPVEFKSFLELEMKRTLKKLEMLKGS